MWDNETTFSLRQPLADADSTNIVDGGPDDLGLGEPVYLQISLTRGASGDLTVAVDTSDADDMTGSAQLVRYLVEGDAVAGGGTVLAAPLPTGCKRYLRLHYSGASGGKVTAGLVQGAQTNG